MTRLLYLLQPLKIWCFDDKGQYLLSSIINCHMCTFSQKFSEEKVKRAFQMPWLLCFLNFLTVFLMGHISKQRQPTNSANQSTSNLLLELHLNKPVMLKNEKRKLFNYLFSCLCYFDGFCSNAFEFSVCLFYNYWMTTCSTAISIRFWWLIKSLLTGSAQMNLGKPDQWCLCCCI